MDRFNEDMQDEDGTDSRRAQELEKVNERFAELVQVLIERIEGEDEAEYSYSFNDGWKEKQDDDIHDQLRSEDLDAQLREIEQLIERYREGQ